jgi:hypothetical protein
MGIARMNVAKKRDPSVTYLNKLGYNVVKLPRVGIEPMDVIGRDQTMQWLGPIDSIWSSAIPKPQPGPPKPASAVNGQRTDALDLSVGLNILGNTLAAFGVSVPSLDLAYKRAHAVQFSYNNVTITTVAPFAAGSYLAKGELQSDNPAVKNYFLSGQAKAFLIVQVLKSNSLTVSAIDSHGTAVDVDFSVFQGVDAKVGIKPSSFGNSSVSFSGPDAITFGFAVQQIAREGDAWSLHGVVPSGDIAFAVPGVDTGRESGSPAPTVFDTGALDCRLDI